MKQMLASIAARHTWEKTLDEADLSWYVQVLGRFALTHQTEDNR